MDRVCRDHPEYGAIIVERLSPFPIRLKEYIIEQAKNLIELRPEKDIATVYCSSHEKGKAVMDACKSGCIGCTLCVKQCEYGAIVMDNNIPVIDYEKCTGCGKCAEKCPKKVIHIA